MTPDLPPPVALPQDAEATPWCPECAEEPAGLTIAAYCWRHMPPTDGTDDALATPEAMGYTEAGGESNRAACAWIHRDAR